MNDHPAILALLGLGAAERRPLLERLLAGSALAGELDRLADLGPDELARARVRLHGAPGVDGGATERTLDALAESAELLAHPSAATALAVQGWRRATMDGGVSGPAVAVAEALLARERDEKCSIADPDDRTMVLALADKWTAHARDFVAGLDWPKNPFPDPDAPASWLAVLPLMQGADGELTSHPRGATVPGLPPWQERVLVAVVLSRGADEHDRRGLGAWLDERDREVESLAVDGVPWLSVQLEAWLRKLGAADDVLDDWRKGERGTDPGQGSLPLAAPPPLALPGWTSVAIPRTGGWGVSRAALYLAGVVWREVVRPTIEPPRYPTSAVLFPLAQAIAGPRGGPWGERWQVAAIDPEVLRKVEASGVLTTAEAQSVIRQLPELARQAANGDGQPVTVYACDGGEVIVQLTAHARTEVAIRGGWQVFAALAGHPGGASRVSVKATAWALSKLPVQWHAGGAAAHMEGTTTLIVDVNGHNGPDGDVVTFALPRVWWPGFSAELAGVALHAREARSRVPVHPQLPPTTNPKLGERPSALEIRATTWIREHLDQVDPERGAPVPWLELADEVGLSTNAQRSRRVAVLHGLLFLWIEEARWFRTGDLWRPAYGWTGPGGLLEAREQRDAGKAQQRRKRR